jgi:hypothetical protein
MNPDEWIREFRALHQAAKKGELAAADLKTYEEACEQLARSLVAAQGLIVEAGKAARRHFRVAQALQVDIDFANGRQRLMTQDLSCGGFSVLVKEAPSPKELPGFTLKLPGGAEPLVGRLKLINVVPKSGAARVGFAFEGVPETQLKRLELGLFEMVLARMA